LKKYLVTLGNLLSTKFLKSQKQLYATPKHASLVAIGFKEQSFKTIDELLDDKVGLETTRCV
jgi:hypothetical protein